MEKMAQPSATCNYAPMDHTLNDLKTYGERAAGEGTAAHEAEAAIWSRVLQLGKQALELLFALVGPGDVGDSVVLPDGAEVQRLEASHPRVGSVANFKCRQADSSLHMIYAAKE